MKTKLILFFGALAAACSLTSCDIYGYPVGYGYGGYSPSYSCPYYGSGYYSSPLLSYSSFYSRPYYSGYSSYNRSYCAPVRSSFSSGPLVSHMRPFSSPSFGSSPFHHGGFSGGGFSGGHGFGGGGFSSGHHHH